MCDKLTYSPKHILSILDNYASISSGDYSQDKPKDSVKSRLDIFKSPFENAIISKADIDIAIDSLGKPGKWLHWCRDIESSPADDGLIPKQYTIAKYIQGDPYINMKRIARELSLIA